MTGKNGEDFVVLILFAIFFAGMFLPSLKHRWDKRKTARAE